MKRFVLVVNAVLLAAGLVSGCGSDGKAGKDGVLCSVAQNTDGSATISCDDGSSVTVTGGVGEQGPAGDPGVAGATGDTGAVGDPGVAGVPGDPGTPGESCGAVDNNDGTYTITCGTDVVTLGDGTSCTVVENGNETVTITCEDGTTTTFSAPKAESQFKLTLVIENLVFGIDASGFVTATFDVTDGTLPVTGLTNAASTLYLAGLVEGANGDADQWQYWTGVDDTTLVEGPPGTYLLTSNKLDTDVPANTTTQRGVARIALAGYNTVVSTYDFLLTAPETPIAAGKDVVNDASCKSCHGFGVTIHGYGRNNTKVCVVCHSPNYNADIAAHEADMVTMVHQIHTNKADTFGALHVSGHGENWPTLRFPGTILNCAKCHNTVAEADNWNAKPTMAACDSCHTTIAFDGSAYTGISGLPGYLHSQTTNANCLGCHDATAIAGFHVPAVNDDASQRLVEANITGVVVDANGGVTVSFSVTESGVAKTNVTAAGTSFTLAKLVPATAGTPSYWQSYLSKVRTKGATSAPVIQGRTEEATDGGILTNNNDGTYTYKFKLLNADTFNADTTGDIRSIAHAQNVSAGSIDDNYRPGALPNMMFPVAYEPTLTHRVAIILSGIKTNAFLDFVPAGNTAQTRNIVSRAACNKCHGDSKLHKGFAVELCVGCHNQNSFDPFSGPDGLGVLTAADTAPAGTSSVELERIVHKIHMGKDLEKGFVLNGSHDYSDLQFPRGVPTDSRTPNASDCKACHDESNAAMTEAGNWQIGTRACGSCHDGDLPQAHIAANTVNGVSTCALCHSPGGVVPVAAAHGFAE
ncbi:MAG: hypothetical protein AUK47_21470 [Deltaproteobacteria bacterium CG2_30_63_29]|nr:MAG: hypothetical protein AUK47_21470 [Deltaproteobacteria bacterium CG2_30_63_29]